MGCKLISSLFVAFLIVETAQAQTCLGPCSEAEQNVLYFHGLDSLRPGKLELENRKNLEAWAQDQRVCVAAVRSGHIKIRKRHKFLTWRPYGNKSQFNNALRVAKRKCFQPLNKSKKPLGVIGFSDGGYYVSSLYHSCQLPEASWIMAIGSSEPKGIDESLSLEKCGYINIMASPNEYVFKTAQEYQKKLVQMDGHAQFRSVETLEEFQHHSLPKFVEQGIRTVDLIQTLPVVTENPGSGFESKDK